MPMDSTTRSADDGGVYFTVAYILMTIAIVTQVFYYSFMVYSYQSIKRKLIEKGQLLQIIPVISIATVNTQSHVPSSIQIGSSIPPPVYPGSSRVIGNKEVPPPYAP